MIRSIIICALGVIVLRAPLIIAIKKMVSSLHVRGIPWVECWQEQNEGA